MSLPDPMFNTPDTEQIITAKSKAAMRAFRAVELPNIHHIKFEATHAKTKRFNKRHKANATTSKVLLTSIYVSSSASYESDNSSGSNDSFNDVIIPEEINIPLNN